MVALWIQCCPTIRSDWGIHTLALINWCDKCLLIKLHNIHHIRDRLVRCQIINKKPKSEICNTLCPFFHFFCCVPEIHWRCVPNCDFENISSDAHTNVRFLLGQSQTQTDSKGIYFKRELGNKGGENGEASGWGREQRMLMIGWDKGVGCLRVAGGLKMESGQAVSDPRATKKTKIS